MLSSKLIRLIEDHWEDLAVKCIRMLREHPGLDQFRKLPESALQDWGRVLLKNLGEWLISKKDEEVGRFYEGVGRARYRELVPLHESVLALHLLKDTVVDYVRDRGFAQSSVDLYAEEELEHRLGLFFDTLVYHMVKGYETELRRAMHAMA